MSEAKVLYNPKANYVEWFHSTVMDAQRWRGHLAEDAETVCQGKAGVESLIRDLEGLGKAISHMATLARWIAAQEPEQDETALNLVLGVVGKV